MGVTVTCRRASGICSLLAAAAIVAGCSELTPIEGTDLAYRRVSPPVAYEMLRDSPDELLLDLRPAVGEPTGLLGQSRHLPLADLPHHLSEFDTYRGRTFLVYCGGDRQCGESGMRLLVEHGCVYAVLIDGRLDGWASVGADLTAEPAGAVAPAASASPPPGI